MYTVSARNQIFWAASRPMPVIVEPLQVGELCAMPLMVFAPEPSASR